MKKVLFVFVAMLVAASAVAEELMANSAFYSPKEQKNETIAIWQKNGVKLEKGMLPYAWSITTNGLKVSNGQVRTVSAGKNRVSVHMTSTYGEIIFYSFMRTGLNKMDNNTWGFFVYAHGTGAVTPVAYGYDAAGKCVYFKRFDRKTLKNNAYPAPWILSRKDFEGKNAVSFSIGIAVSGKADIYAVSLKSVSADDLAKMKAAAAEEQKSRTLTNGSFESKGGWALVKHDGAEGYMALVKGGRTGEYALRLVKTNGKGFLQLKALKPVKFDGGAKYVFRGYFSTQTSSLDSMLLFRSSFKENEKHFLYDDIDRSFGLPSQALLINTNHGEWQKRVGSFLPKKDGQVYFNVILYGNPADVLLDDLEFSPDNFKRPAPSDLTKRTTFPYTKEQVYEILAKRTPDEAFIRRSGDRMEMVLNGRAVVPTLYKPESFHSDYVYNRYTEFSEAKVTFMMRPVQLTGSKADTGIVLAPGKYNYEKLEEAVMYALRQDPYARLVICLGGNEPYPGWGAANPDDLWRNEEGQFGWGLWGNCEGFVNNMSEIKLSGLRAKWIPWPFGSYSSRSYRDAMTRSIKDITAYLMKSPIGKAVVGFHIGGGHDGQYQYFRPDYSKVATASFRKFLEQKYGSIDKFNLRNGTKHSSFAEIKIPSYKTMRYAKEPFDNSLKADYKEFQRRESWSLKHEFADAARQAAGKRVFVSAYGMPLEYHGRTFAEHKGGIDLLAVPSWYPFRQMGYAIGAKPDATFALHEKMWLNELDLRTWTEPAKGEVYDMWVGSAVNLPYWESVHRKFAGVALAHNSPWWYYSMYRYFDRPEVMAEIKKAMLATERLMKVPVNKFRPDVCVVRSERGDDVLSAVSSADVNSCIFPYQLMQFEMSGVPYDLHELRDVTENPALHNYKLYVYMHTAELTEKDREVIEKLKKSGKLVVMMYNSGYFDEVSGKTDNMTGPSGFKVSTVNRYGRAVAITGRHKLTAGINPMLSGSELSFSRLAVRGTSPHSLSYQVFRIEDAKDSEVLARYTDGTVAIAKRDNVIYAAAPFSLSAKLFNNLAKSVGAYCVADAGQSIHMNGNFISLHGTKPGKAVITLPPGVNKVTDLFEGNNIPVRDGKFALDVKNGKSYWFLLTK